MLAARDHLLRTLDVSQAVGTRVRAIASRRRVPLGRIAVPRSFGTTSGTVLAFPRPVQLPFASEEALPWLSHSAVGTIVSWLPRRSVATRRWFAREKIIGVPVRNVPRASSAKTSIGSA